MPELPLKRPLPMSAYQGKGCALCNNTGYKGRVGFYQVMPMLEEIRELILNGANTAEIKRESMRSRH